MDGLVVTGGPFQWTEHLEIIIITFRLLVKCFQFVMMASDQYNYQYCKRHGHVSR